MAKNKNLSKTGLYYWDEDLKEWRPVNFNFSTNGSLIVSSYAASPVHIIETSGTPTHFSGTVGASPVDTITTGTNTRAILLENTHASQNILISLDDGSNWKTIRPYGVLSLDVAVDSFQIKGSGASTTYEGIYTV